MKLHIDAFEYSHGTHKIPKKYTCDGEQISPHIKWEDVPENTKSFALIMENLDAPHRSTPLALWIVYNIPGDVKEIETNSIPKQAKIGTNDLGKARYTGPCQSPGPIRHEKTSIQLYALDTELDLPAGATKHDLVKAMKNHILEKVEFIAFYQPYA
ncbi:YbhB/YbcL family Raf kinase inhibitor-like protein [Candidatus Dependentiae bacterium]|nr:YbhB/YbcL family Raf kinase inhibitor-like protein [Candidatus Dependentiae bacterium]